MKSIGKQIYIYFALIIIGMCFAGASLVFAQTEEGSTSGSGTDAAMPGRPADVREDIRNERMENRTARDERMTERRGALGENLQNRITNLAENITNRMYAAILRFEQISGRLETRIEKLRERGVDTTAAEAELEKVGTSLGAAKDILGDMDILVEQGVTSDEPRTAFKAIRDDLKEAGTEIRAAHAALRSTLALLKEAVRAADTETGVSDAVRAQQSTEAAEANE